MRFFSLFPRLDNASRLAFGTTGRADMQPSDYATSVVHHGERDMTQARRCSSKRYGVQ
jgi:hypothetical protein